LFNPAIVLPDRDYTDEQLEAVLCHELNHLRRKDVLVKWLSVLACVVHWFNPLVWLTRREIDRACELACDEAVIHGLDIGGKQNYGDALIYVAADSKKPRTILSTTMYEEKKDLKERLSAIMKSKKRTRAAVIASAAVMCAAVLAACALGAGNINLTAMTPYPKDAPFNGEFAWGETVYTSYANAAYNDFYNKHRGSQIGYVWQDGGSKDLKVFEVKGYKNTEWLFLYMYGEVGLKKAENVSAIPGELLVLRFATQMSASESLNATHFLNGRSTEYILSYENMSPIVDWICGLKLQHETFEPGNTPGDGDGGEVYAFDNGYGEVSYVKNGTDNCFVLYGGDWHKVQNPSDPPLDVSNAADTDSNADYPADTNMVKRGTLDSIVRTMEFDATGITFSIPAGIIPSHEYLAPVKLAIEVGGLDDSMGDRNFPVFTGWEENIENAAGQEFSVPLWNIGGKGAHFALTFSDGETLYYSALYADWLKANGKTPLDHTPGYIYPMINGYITNFNMETRTFDFDEAQWLDSIKDADYLKEIGVDPDSLPNGFYIHNPDAAVRTVTIMPGASILMQSAGGLKLANVEEFSNLLNDGLGRRLFEVEFVDDKASVIMERYLP
jgi:hypothetical protein